MKKNAELIAIQRQKEIDVKLFHIEQQLSFLLALFSKKRRKKKTTEYKSSLIFAPPSRVVEKEITHRNCFICNNKLQWIRNLFDFILCCFPICSVLFGLFQLISAFCFCCLPHPPLSKNTKPRNCFYFQFGLIIGLLSFLLLTVFEWKEHSKIYETHDDMELSKWPLKGS